MKTPTVLVQVYMPEKLRDLIREAASAEGSTTSEYIRQSVIKRMEKIKRGKR